MKIEIQKNVVDKYPDYSMGIVYLSVKNIDYDSLKNKLKDAPKDFPPNKEAIEAKWQQIYADMNASTKRLASVTSLWSLIDRYGELQNINFFVDAYNYISIHHGIPMGGYDITSLPEGNITLRYASKGDKFQPLGLNQIEKIKDEREIVYYSGEQVICRYWNNKDSDISKITNNTQEVVIIFDYIGEKNGLISAMDELIALISDSCSVVASNKLILNAEKLSDFVC